MPPKGNSANRKSVESSASNPDLQDFFSATLDVLNEEITGRQYLGRLNEFAGADAAACIWWSAGNPGQFFAEFSGDEVDLPAEWLNLVDSFLEHCPSRETGFLDEIPGPDKHAGYISPAAQIGENKLVACLDWYPSRVLLVLVRHQGSDPWTAADRDSLRSILPIIGKSVTTKKALSSLADQLDLTKKIFDSLQNAIITLLPDGEVLTQNRAAADLEADGSLLGLTGNKLEFRDRAVQDELKEQLAMVRDFPSGHIRDYAWYKMIPTSTGRGGLFMTMRVLNYETWRIESAPYERAVVITLANSQLNALPGETRLREFYGLTPAQARFTNELVRTGSIEDASVALNISVHTGRSHIRAIYHKAGVDNMPQLLQEIGRSITPYA